MLIRPVGFWRGTVGGGGPVFPNVEEVLTQGFSSATTTHNVNMPASVSAGQLLLMLVTAFDLTGAGYTITQPAGWTQAYSTSFSGNTQARAAFYQKVSDGTEGGTTVNVATSDTATMAVQVWRISSWFGTLAGVANTSLTTDTVTTTHDLPSLAPSWGSAKNLFIAAYHAMDDDATLTVAPTNYGTIANANSGAGTDAGCSMMTARRELEAASDDPAAATFSQSERVRGVTIAVRPI